MINNIKTTFTIKDLENLSGVKAHTIRIWEKRYDLFCPIRTETNIRVYDLKSLQKLLNVVFLQDYGYKISRIASCTEEEIPEFVRKIVSDKNADNHAINMFKLAMMNFDHSLFINTYNWLAQEKTFRQIFQDVFIPLLEEIGALWQTDTITPAHEHFVSHIIRQKVLLNIHEASVNQPTQLDKVFVLFLPLNEIHDLGLLYLNYEIVNSGYQVIYLGESMPIDNLKDLKNHFSTIVFVSYFTVQPENGEVMEYIAQMAVELLDETNEIWLLGRKVKDVETNLLPERVTVFNALTDLFHKL
ncbi:MerR family transcriptional regulator [Flavobacterium sp. NG2]|uniref:MerR family transcriptional regulator n=1 Tax=Flavobacterium sp. NG2 TaxID=3097547 RepID=UPI002A8054CE|nr:MerR family transcriptional regulator [Flavobacterium sp. NG2]WPR71061.1 MerR family transcriptional regulator [Flavobacterium sp. NG2]